jgi:hypothetical protein
MFTETSYTIFLHPCMKKSNYISTLEPNSTSETLLNRYINILCKRHFVALKLHITTKTSSPNPSNKQKFKLIPPILFIIIESHHTLLPNSYLE